MAKSNKIVYMGTGRRKSSIARVRLVEGTGKITPEPGTDKGACRVLVCRGKFAGGSRPSPTRYERKL